MVELTAEEALAAGVAVAPVMSPPEQPAPPAPPPSPPAAERPLDEAAARQLPAAERPLDEAAAPQLPAAERPLDETAARQLAGLDKLAAGVERLTRSFEALATAQAAQHRRVNLQAGLWYLEKWVHGKQHELAISSYEKAVYPSGDSCKRVIHAALRGSGYTLPLPSRSNVYTLPIGFPPTALPNSMPPPNAVEYMEGVLFAATGLTLRLEERVKDGSTTVKAFLD